MSTIEQVPGPVAGEFLDLTNNFNHWTYLLFRPGTSSIVIQQHLDAIYQQKVNGITNPAVQKMKYGLQSLPEIPLGRFVNNSIGPVLPITIIYVLGGLALVILLTSFFNFTNLSVARSLTRAKEIGVRKAVGASRWQVFSQFLLESVLTAMLALVMATFFVLLFKHYLLELNFARIFHWDLESNMTVYGIFIIFALIVGIIAGLYPATILSGFKPVSVLKNLVNMKIFFRVGIRKVLLVSQFTVSLFFVLTVIVIQNQLRLFSTQDYGFNVNRNIMVKLNGTPPGVFRNELLRFNNIQSVTAVSHVAATGRDLVINVKKNIHEPEWKELNHFSVDENYLDNMKLTLVAGRFFAAGAPGVNEQYIVINEEGVKRLEYISCSDAIGKKIISQVDSSTKTIIGVVKDYNHRTFVQTISALALSFDPSEFNVLQVDYSGNYREATESIEKAWAGVHPNLKVDYEEVKGQIERFYDVVFGDIMRVLVFISLLAVCISCLGLLGIATFTTETRLREISIRKVLGSSKRALIYQLSREFFGVFAGAIIVGIPLTWIVNNLWLDMIAYRTSVSPEVIVQGVSLLLLFGLSTISYHMVRATMINPLPHLKSE